MRLYTASEELIDHVRNHRFYAGSLHRCAENSGHAPGTTRESAACGWGALGLFADTAGAGSRTKYLVRFREECKAIRQTLGDVGRAERQAFETACARIEAYLADMPLPRHPGLAVFAAAARGYLYAVPLPERPATRVGWGSDLLLTPLEEVLDEHERVAVVLTDRCQARLFTIYLGAIEEQRELISADPGKSNIAGIAGNYARHYQEHVQRHLRRTAHATVELLRTQPFDRLILGEPDDVLARFKEVLPRPLRARFAGGLSLGILSG